jgi:cation/acetate symporter
MGYIILAKYMGITFFGIIDTGAGIFGAPVNLLATYFVSKAYPAPSQKLQEEVMDLRYPEQMTYKDGEVWMEDSVGK